jgi:signal transduction histidine kinase
MRTWQRGAFQGAVLAIPALVCFVELQHFWLPTFDRPLLIVLDDLLPGSAFAIAGLIAWSNRPANRVGVLMILIGIGLLMGTGSILVQQPSPLAETLTLVLGNSWSFVLIAFGSLWTVALLHLLLAFPSGLLASRLDRALVVFLYVAVPVLGLITAVVTVSSLSGISHGEASLLASATYQSAIVVYLVCLLLGVGLIIRRWFFAGSARRRSMSVVTWSLVPITMAFAPALYAVLPKPSIWLEFVQASPLFLAVLPAGFLAAMLRSTRDLTSVADLVVKLSDGLLPAQLQPALASTLHDPSLEVVYWLPTLGWYADLEGRPVSLPAQGSPRAVSVLGDPADPIAALVYDSSLRDEDRLVDTAAAAVRLALENARLQVQLRAQLDEVRQSRARLVAAADDERRRVERDLHDGAQQQLVTLLLSLQLAKTGALRRSDRQTAQMLDESIQSLHDALAELRMLARGIHPTILVEAGLLAAIRSLGERCPMEVEVTGDVGRLEPRLETALYYVAAEAITNAVKHSGGHRIRVDVRRSSGWASVEITDDGVGGADVSKGSGLVGLSDRVAAVGGRLNVRSDGSSGTSLHAEVPCA